jgi:hypothetical protein
MSITQSILGEFRVWLSEEISDRETNAREAHKIAMNSYGAGYERGSADALRAAESMIVELIMQRVRAKATLSREARG